MNEKTAIRKDEKLTKLAKKIFGDIVSVAYITTYDFNGDKDAIKSRLDIERFSDCSGGYINYDAKTIWIKFTNSKIVEFHNSEWASISAVVDEYYEA